MDRRNVLLAFDLSDQRVHKGIVRYANEHEWHLCPYLSSDHFLPHGWSGDGAIMCYGKGMGKFIDSLSMPKVDISAADLPDAIPQVTVDNLGVGQLAADHFLDRGFQHFAYFSWPLVDVNRVRRKTFREALVGRGVDPAAIHDICQPAPGLLSDWDRHQEAILGQLRGLPRPIGVFTGQDNLGATLIEVCLRSQIDVPEEVAILGAGNVEFVCECLSVPLSSIDTRLDEVGFLAAQQLDRLMNGEITNHEPPLWVKPAGVVHRKSTDSYAVPHPGVARGIRFIKESFHEAISLESIGTHVGMSKRGMGKAFLKHLGRSPAAELRRVRLENAKRMLTESSEKIDAIARACGYSNSSNLSFAFSKETGMTPRAYRNARQAGESS